MDNLQQMYVDRGVNVLPKHPPSEFQRFTDSTYQKTINIGTSRAADLPAAGFSRWGSAPRKQAPPHSVPQDIGVSWAKSKHRYVGGRMTQEVLRPLFKGGSLSKAPFWDPTGNAAGVDRPAPREGPAYQVTALTKVHNGVWADVPTRGNHDQAI